MLDIMLCQMRLLTLRLAPKVDQAAQINELLVGNLLGVDVHAIALAGQEIGRIDCARAAAVHCIECIPAQRHGDHSLQGLHTSIRLVSAFLKIYTGKLLAAHHGTGLWSAAHPSQQDCRWEGARTHLMPRSCMACSAAPVTTPRMPPPSTTRPTL
jgi:hypothetical protein